MSAREGNKNHLLHGGSAARRHLSAGTEFPESSPARRAELAIQAEYETVGRASIVARNARRVQAVADIYTDEFFNAAVSGDVVKRDSYAKILLWSIRLANALWEQVKDEEKEQEPEWVEALEAAKDAQE